MLTTVWLYVWGAIKPKASSNGKTLVWTFKMVVKNEKEEVKKSKKMKMLSKWIIQTVNWFKFEWKMRIKLDLWKLMK